MTMCAGMTEREELVARLRECKLDVRPAPGGYSWNGGVSVPIDLFDKVLTELEPPPA